MRWLLVALAACGSSPPATPAPAPSSPAPHREDVPSAPALVADVHWLADPARAGRLAGSEGERASFEWAAARFRALHLEVTSSPVELPSGRSQNLIATLPGKDPAAGWILVGAHMDHLGPGYPGADDNASGIAALLGVASAIAATTPAPDRTIVFVAFGAEEQGLLGSRAMAKAPPRPLASNAAVINLDMVGRSPFLGATDYAMPKQLAGIADGPAVGILDDAVDSPLLKVARDACKAVNLTTYAAEDFPLLQSQVRAEAKGRSDDTPFAAAGAHTLFFSTSLQNDYHQRTDTPDKIDAATLHSITACVRGTVDALSGEDRANAAKQ